MNRLGRLAVLFAASVAVLGLVASPVAAQDHGDDVYEWTGGDGSSIWWGTPGNWTGGVVTQYPGENPPVGGDDARFSDTGISNNVVDLYDDGLAAPIYPTLNLLRFEGITGGGYTIQDSGPAEGLGAGTLVLGGIVQDSGTNVISAALEGNETFAATISGGTLTLSNQGNEFLATESFSVGGATTLAITGTAGSNASYTLGGGVLELTGLDRQFTGEMDMALATGTSGLGDITFSNNGGGYVDPSFAPFTGQGGILARPSYTKTGVVTGSLGTDTQPVGQTWGEISGDNYALLWTGQFTPTASGDYSFAFGRPGNAGTNSLTQPDDDGSFYIDLNGDGIFQTTEGFASGDAGSQTFNLTADVAYSVAIGFREGGGGQEGAPLWQVGSGGNWQRINPAADGVWSRFGFANVTSDGSISVTASSVVDVTTPSTFSYDRLSVAAGQTLTKQGPGTLEFRGETQANELLSGSAVAVAEGTLRMVYRDANPLGQAALALEGGTFELDSPATIQSITLHGSARSYAIVPSGLVPGVRAYTDRTYPWAEIPESMLGFDFVQTAVDDKWNADLLIDVTLSRDTTLYVWFDRRNEGPGRTPPQQQVPQWAIDNGFTATGEAIAYTDPALQWFDVYALNLPAGTYTGILGPTLAEFALYGFGAPGAPEIDMTDTDVSVTADSVLRITGSAPSVQFGSLTFDGAVEPVLLVEGRPVAFAGTSFAAAGTFGLSAASSVKLGALDDNDNAVTFLKTGAADVVVEGAGSLGDLTVLESREGRLVGIQDETGNPFGLATLVVRGGELALASADEDNKTFDNSIQSFGGILSAGAPAAPAAAVTLSGAITLADAESTTNLRGVSGSTLWLTGSLGGEGNLEVTAGDVLFDVTATTDYTGNLTVSGGNLAAEAAMDHLRTASITGGIATFAAPVAAGQVRVSGGVANFDAPVTLAASWYVPDLLSERISTSTPYHPADTDIETFLSQTWSAATDSFNLRLHFDNDAAFDAEVARIGLLPGESFNSSAFSAAWLGTFTPNATGTWTFGYDNVDDHAAIWIDLDGSGTFVRIHGRWGSNQGVGSGSALLEAGVGYPIVFAMRDTGGDGYFRNAWFEGPGLARTAIWPGEASNAGFWGIGDRALATVSGGEMNVNSSFTTPRLNVTGGTVNLAATSQLLNPEGDAAVAPLVVTGTGVVHAHVAVGGPGNAWQLEVGGGARIDGTHVSQGDFHAHAAGSTGTEVPKVHFGGVLFLNDPDALQTAAIDNAGLVVVDADGALGGVTVNFQRQGFLGGAVAIVTEDPQTTFPTLDVPAYSALGGNLYGAVYSGPEQNVTLHENAILGAYIPDGVPPELLLPSRAELGGAILYQAALDFGAAAEYRLGDDDDESIFKGLAVGLHWTPSGVPFEATLADISADQSGLEIIMARDFDLNGAVFDSENAERTAEFLGAGRLQFTGAVTTVEGSALLRTGLYAPTDDPAFNPGFNTQNSDIVRLAAANVITSGQTLTVRHGRVRIAAGNVIQDGGQVILAEGATYWLDQTPTSGQVVLADPTAAVWFNSHDRLPNAVLDNQRIVIAEGVTPLLIVGQADINTSAARGGLTYLMRNSNITFGAGTATDYRFRGGEDARLVVGDGKYVLGVANQRIYIHQDSLDIQPASVGATIGFAGFGDYGTRLQVNEGIAAGGSHLVFGSATPLSTVVGGGDVTRVTEIPTGVVQLSAAHTADSAQVYSGMVERTSSGGQVNVWTVHPGAILRSAADNVFDGEAVTVLGEPGNPGILWAYNGSNRFAGGTFYLEDDSLVRLDQSDGTRNQGGTFIVGRDGAANARIEIQVVGTSGNSQRGELLRIEMGDGDYLTLVNQPNRALHIHNFDFSGEEDEDVEATLESIGPFFARLLRLIADEDDVLTKVGPGRLDIEQADNTGTFFGRIVAAEGGFDGRVRLLTTAGAAGSGTFEAVGSGMVTLETTGVGGNATFQARDGGIVRITAGGAAGNATFEALDNGRIEINQAVTAANNATFRILPGAGATVATATDSNWLAGATIELLGGTFTHRHNNASRFVGGNFILSESSTLSNSNYTADTAQTTRFASLRFDTGEAFSFVPTLTLARPERGGAQTTQFDAVRIDGNARFDVGLNSPLNLLALDYSADLWGQPLTALKAGAGNVRLGGATNANLAVDFGYMLPDEFGVAKVVLLESNTAILGGVASVAGRMVDPDDPDETLNLPTGVAHASLASLQGGNPGDYYYSLADNKLTLHVKMPEVSTTEWVWDGGTGAWTDMHWNSGGGVPDYRGIVILEEPDSDVTVADARRAWTVALDDPDAVLGVGAGGTLSVGNKIETIGALGVADGGVLKTNDLKLVGTGSAGVAAGGALTAYGTVEVASSASLNVAGALRAATLDTSGTTTFAAGSAADLGTLLVRQGTTTLAAGAAARNVTVNDGAVLNAAAGLSVTERFELSGRMTATITGGSLGVWGSDVHNEIETLALQGGTISLALVSDKPTGAAAYYAFDDPTKANWGLDSSGNERHAIGFWNTTGDNISYVAEGRIGGALDFNGDALKLPGLPSQTNAPFSFSAWVNWDGWSDTTQDGIYGANIPGGGANNVVLFEIEAADRMRLRLGPSGTNKSDLPNVTAGQWAHVAFVHDPTGASGAGLTTYYLNGVTGPGYTFTGQTGTIFGDGGSWYHVIGRSHDNRWFRGLIDEVFLFTRVLDVGEVTALYASGLAGAYGGAPDLSAVPISVTAPSTFQVSTGATDLGVLTMQAERLSIIGSPLTFDHAAIAAGISAVTFDNSTNVHLTRNSGIDADGADVTITKSGAGELVLDKAGNLGAGSSFRVTGGVLTAGSPDVLGSAPVELAGGTLRLSSIGSPASLEYGSAVSAVSGSSAITAGKSGMIASDAGPQAVTLNATVAVAPGATLALGGTDDYSLSVAGAIDDGAGGRGGNLAVGQGSVALEAGANVSRLDVTDGSLQAGAPGIAVGEKMTLGTTRYHNLTPEKSFTALGAIDNQMAETIVLGGQGSILTAGPGEIQWNASQTQTSGGFTMASLDNWIVTGNDGNIHGTADAGYFVYREVDVATPLDLIVRVEGFVGGTNDYRKAGLMVRDSLAANSSNAYIYGAPSTAAGVTPQMRPASGAGTSGSPDIGRRVNEPAPTWIRLVYAGDGLSFDYYMSLDGQSWTQLNDPAEPYLYASPRQMTAAMTGTMYVGLAVCAADSWGQSTTATFTNLSGLPNAVLPFNNLTGEGTIAADAVVRGTLAPGNSFGTIDVEGDLLLDDTSTYAVQLAGRGPTLVHDQVNVTGTLTIDDGSALTLNWVPGADAGSMFGGVYRIATYGLLDGEFAAPTAENSNVINYIYDIDYEAEGGAAIDVVLYDLLAGDADLDGKVDVADYVAVARNFGVGTSWLSADVTFDGKVDVADYVEIARNFGAVKSTIGGMGAGGGFSYEPMMLGAAGGGGPAVVPEPATWTMLTLLAAIGGMVSLVRRRRRRGT